MSRGLVLLLVLSAFASELWAAPGIPAMSVTANGQGGQDYSVTIQILA